MPKIIKYCLPAWLIVVSIVSVAECFQTQTDQVRLTILEVEKLNSKPSAGKVAIQDMRSFGNWSGSQQLFWPATRIGQRIEISVPASKNGKHDVSIDLTKAPDYGDIAIGFSGRQIARFSGYSGRVEKATVNLGTLDLKKGGNVIIISVAGKSARSRGYAVGIDRIAIKQQEIVADVKQMNLPTGCNLYHSAGGKLSQRTVTMASWDANKSQLSFSWDTSRLRQANAIVWQLYTKPPKNAPLKNTQAASPISENGGLLESRTSFPVNKRNRVGVFVTDLGALREKIEKSKDRVLYLRAIPVNNGSAKRPVGQPSNTIQIRLPVILAKPILLHSGNALFYSAKRDGKLNVFGGHNWSKDWFSIVSGNFGGSGQSDLLFYDRLEGVAKIFTTSNGKLTLLAHHQWKRHWDIIVPGNFNGDKITDFLVYSRYKRECKVFTVSANGSIHLLKHRKKLRLWDKIIPGQFSGDGLTDLLFYSRVRGEGKFFEMKPRGEWAQLKEYQWMKTWDQIIPGDFNGDSITDLFFYRRVIGDSKTFSTDGHGGMRLMKTAKIGKFWDMIVPGQFGGSQRTDLFFFDRVARTSCVMIVDGNGFAWKNARTEPNAYVSHIIPGKFDQYDGTDLIFYDNHYDVRLLAFRCMDNNGGRKTSITPEQVATLVDETNKTYLQAGIRIAYDPNQDFREAPSDILNSLDLEKQTRFDGKTLDEYASGLKSTKGWSDEKVKSSSEYKEFKKERDAVCEARKVMADKYAGQFPDRLVVFFRYGDHPTKSAGSGFSSFRLNRRFVVMAGYKNRTWYFQDSGDSRHGTAKDPYKLLTHEAGHYFGLIHTFGQKFSDLSMDEIQDKIRNIIAKDKTVAGVIKKLDGDSKTKDDGIEPVFDTPADVSVNYFLKQGLNPAALNNEVKLTSKLHGVDYVFSPDRHNVMSYMGYCDEFVRISPDQVRRMRYYLSTNRRQLIGKSISIDNGVKKHGQ